MILDPPRVAAALSAFSFVLAVVAVSRGHWILANLLSKATVALSIGVLPLALMEVGYAQIGPGSGVAHPSVATMIDWRATLGMCAPGLVIGGGLWLAARRHLRPRRPELR